MRGYKIHDHKNYVMLRPMVIEAFKILRKEGLITKVNYLCCMDGASSAINYQYEKSPKKDKIVGAAYFHKQDEEAFREHGKLYIRFGALGDKTDDGIKTALVGGRVVNALIASGVDKSLIEWDDNPDTCILIGGE